MINFEVPPSTAAFSPKDAAPGTWDLMSQVRGIGGTVKL
jgi:hypothetical protein